MENIAYDTFGHCFMTEDGGEVDNKFIRNLGSNTKQSFRVGREGESDDSNPSTFWSANPQNEWIGNVAAGCEGNGYWFELLDVVKLPTGLMKLSRGMNPKALPLTKFSNNIAHSNVRHGLSKLIKVAIVGPEKLHCISYSPYHLYLLWFLTPFRNVPTWITSIRDCRISQFQIIQKSSRWYFLP